MTKWAPDLPAEKRMASLGLSFTVKTIKFSDVDWESSRSNHARIKGNPVDQDLVCEYALAMESGAEFPRTIVFEDHTKPKPYVFAGGNHRAPAAEMCGDKTIEVYAVKCTDKYLRDHLPRVLNRDHGNRQSKDEALSHCVYEMKTYKKTAAEVCKEYGLTLAVLNTHVLADKVAERLEVLGVSSSGMSKSMLCKLNQIGDDKVLTSAVKMMKSCGIKGEKAEKIVDSIRAERSESGRIAKVKEWEEKIGKPETKPTILKSQSRKTRYLIAVSQLNNLLKDHDTFEKLQVTNDKDRKEAIADAKELIGRIKALLQFGSKESNGVHKRPIIQRRVAAR